MLGVVPGTAPVAAPVQYCSVVLCDCPTALCLKCSVHSRAAGCQDRWNDDNNECRVAHDVGQLACRATRRRQVISDFSCATILRARFSCVGMSNEEICSCACLCSRQRRQSMLRRHRTAQRRFCLRRICFSSTMYCYDRLFFFGYCVCLFVCLYFSLLQSSTVHRWLRRATLYCQHQRRR